MTVEEVKNKYQYRLAKKYLKSEFPFITDIKIKQSDLDDYRHVLFLYPVIDIYEIQKQFGWKINWFINSKNINDEYHIAAIFNIPYSEWNEKIRKPSDNILMMISDLDLPREMKINHKSFSLSNAFIDRNSFDKLTPDMFSNRYDV